MSEYNQAMRGIPWTMERSIRLDVTADEARELQAILKIDGSLRMDRIIAELERGLRPALSGAEPEPMTNEMANALLTGVMHDNMSWMREHND